MLLKNVPLARIGDDLMDSPSRSFEFPFHITASLISLSLLFLTAAAGVDDQALAAEPKPDDAEGDTKFAEVRPWDAKRDLPRPIAEDRTVKYDYPIVYVRVPRPYPKNY